MNLSRRSFMGRSALGTLAVLAAQKQTDPRCLDPQEVRQTVEERRGKLT